MVKNSGLRNLEGFVEYFGAEEGRLDYHNVLLENGFGEIPIELVKSFNKAHESVSLKYNGVSEKGEWGGTYNEKFDGMHIGLKSSFIKVLTKK